MVLNLRFLRSLLRFVSVSCLAISSPQTALAESVVLDRIIAVVNDDIVLQSEVEMELRSSPMVQEAVQRLGASATPQQVEQKLRELETQILDLLIERHLITREATRFQIAVSEADVDRYVQQIVESNNLKNIAELRQAVEESGATWADYRQSIRDQILTHMMVTAWTSKVSEAQVLEHYRKMAREEDAKVEIEKLTFLPQSQEPKDRDRAFAEAQGAASQLRAGQTFTDIVRQFPLGQVSTQTVQRGQIAPQLEDSIFAANVGQVVGPLVSGQGYVVVKVLSHTGSKVLSFDQAKDRIRMMLEEQAYERASKELRQQLRSKAHIDIRLYTDISDEG